MLSKSYIPFSIWCIIILCISTCVFAKDIYGTKVAATTIDSLANVQFYNQLAANDVGNPKVASIQYAEQLRKVPNKNFDFWSFLVILCIPAILRFVNPTYFRNMFIAFRNPNLSARHLREQLSQNSLASLVMDIFFNACFGMYIYQILQYYDIPTAFIINNNLILLAILIAGSAIVYIVKLLTLRLTGYIFSITELTDTYTFNIYLIISGVTN